jgi:ABC-2 type transport system permease protein
MPSTTVVPAYLRLRTMGVGIEDVKQELIYLYIQAAIYAGLTITYFFVRISSMGERRQQSLNLKND